MPNRLDTMRLRTRHERWGPAAQRPVKKLKRPDMVVADLSSFLSPKETTGTATITTQRMLLSGLRPLSLTRTEDGLSLLFPSGFILFRLTEMRDLRRVCQTLVLEFGGGRMELSIVGKTT